MRRSISWCISLLLLTACHDRLHESPVPAGQVSYTCDPVVVNQLMEQTTGQSTLETPGGYVRCHDRSKKMAGQAWGTGGLLLVHCLGSSPEYAAFDLACPYCYAQGGNMSEKLQRLVMKEDQQTALCTKCESEFGAIFWGSPVPTAGPANQESYPLRQYKANLVGSKLMVTN